MKSQAGCGTIAGFRHVVFLDTDEADEVLGTLLMREPDGFSGFNYLGPSEESIEAAVRHLAQWDADECSIEPRPSAEAEDDTARVGPYLLTWNSGLGYIGLERILLNEEYLKKFTTGYVVAGLRDGAAGSGGKPSGTYIRRTDLTATATMGVWEDCEDFLRDVAVIAGNLGDVALEPAAFGRDSWVERSGTGSGLRDERRYPQPAAELLGDLAARYGRAWFTAGAYGDVGYERETGR